MNVLVDTSVWSLALRRTTVGTAPEALELTELIGEGRVLMLGAIRQELLSGVRSSEQFKRLRDALDAFPDIPLQESDYVEAAGYFNTCRGKGVQGSNTDFLICAVAARNNVPVLTTDLDFNAFARLLPFNLHTPRQLEQSPPATPNAG